jgi:glycosyltransferase involved in cell wall biosynthesis
MGPHEAVVSSMRVVHLIGTRFLGGPEKQILAHAERAPRSGVRVMIAAFVEPGDERELLLAARERHLPAIDVPSGGALDARLPSRVTRLLQDEGASLLCAHGYKANVIGRLASWRAKRPFVAVSRGWTGEDIKIRGYEWLDRRFLRWADRVVTVSHSQRERVIACGVPAPRVRVIHNAIDTSVRPEPVPRLRAELGAPAGIPLVVAAGRLSPEKSFADLVEAARRLRSAGIDTFFAVFGEGPERPRLEQQIAAAQLRDRIVLPGFRRNLLAAMGAADVFVSSSRTEGLPNVLLEASACECAVLATDVGGCAEVVVDGVTGRLVPPARPDLLAEGLVPLLTDAALRRRLGQAAREHVEARFGFDAQTRSWRDIYNELLGRGS